MCIGKESERMKVEMNTSIVCLCVCVCVRMWYCMCVCRYVSRLPPTTGNEKRDGAWYQKSHAQGWMNVGVTTCDCGLPMQTLAYGLAKLLSPARHE